MGIPLVPVAVIDDHHLMRSALVRMIDHFPGYEVVLEAGNGEEFQRLAHRSPLAAIAIVDLYMPIMDGFATIAWISRHMPGTRALALTLEKTEETMLRALRAGACGFLTKDVNTSVFKTALDHVSVLGHYHNHDLEVSLHAQAEARNGYERRRMRVMDQLSERELEFLRHVCHENEYTYDVIADLMQVHRRTVDGYRESVFNKFGIKSKVGLVLFAFKWGLVGT